jgi:hypothetical protein
MMDLYTNHSVVGHAGRVCTILNTSTTGDSRAAYDQALPSAETLPDTGERY